MLADNRTLIIEEGDLPGRAASKPAVAAPEERQALYVQEQQRQQQPLQGRSSSCSKPVQHKLLTDSDEEFLDLILDERLTL